MLLASLSLTGCVKEQVRETKSDEEKTSMSIRMSFPRPEGTRATGDTNATDAEAAIKTVDVYVFTDASEGGTYQSHTKLTAADFSTATTAADGDVYQATTQIPASTGKKAILVGINLPTKAATSLEGQTLSRASTNIHTVAIQPSTYDVATNGLPMFSTAVATATLVTDDTQNVVSVKASRLVAKVTVETSTTMSQEGLDGTLGTLSFALNNQNTRFFLLQGAAPDYQDPNYSTYADTDFADATPGSADYVAVASGPQSPVSNYNALYALENTSDDKQGQDLTRVTVSATFIPTNIVNSYTAGSKTVVETANTNSTPTTFYEVITAAGDKVYFNAQADAAAYQADMANSTLETYTNGVCYWYLFLNKTGNNDTQWEVIRNDFYKCNITRIVAPGNPTDALSTDAALTTPEDDTNLTVSVDVLNWNTPVSDDYVLEP